MLTDNAVRKTIPALATALLLGVALPQAPVLAKEKVKPAQAPTSELALDYSVDIPSIDAVGSNVSDEVLAEVLSGKVADHADELAGLDASSIAVPEITLIVTSETDDGPQKATPRISTTARRGQGLSALIRTWQNLGFVVAPLKKTPI